jgi:hypothetical protein
MNISPKITALFSCLLLSAGCAFADTATNLYCWVRPLNISLTGWTNGPLHPHPAILASTKAGNVRVSNQDLVASLSGKPVRTLEKTSTNWFTITTNRNPNPIPDEYITNYFQRAYLAPGSTVYVNFSADARLILVESLSVNSLGPIPVIRDGVPSADYAVTDYLAVQNVSFDNEPQAAIVRSAKYDTLHGLVDSTETAIKSFVFDDKTPGQTLHADFAVQGLASEQVSSVIRANVVLGERADRRMSASVAGIGHVGSGNTFTVLRGMVTAGEGKLETK